MSVASSFDKMTGFWEGEKRLRLSASQPDQVSHTTASIDLEARGQIVAIHYQWIFEKKPQEGLLLLGHSDKPNGVHAVWVDSWHMQDKIMNCEGFELPDCGISVIGKYTAPSGQEWGWRIVVVPEAEDQLDLIMYNVTTEGQEELAVEARYRPR